MGAGQETAGRERSDAAAIVRSCIEGCAFELDGDQAYIERVYRSGADTAGGVVVLRFEPERCSLRFLRQAMLVRTFVEMVRRSRVGLLPEWAAFLQIMRRISDRRADGSEPARRAAVIRRLEIDAGQRAGRYGRRRHRRRAHDDLVSCMPSDGGASTEAEAIARPPKCSRATGR